MIRMNDRDQCLECTLCGECVEIPRRLLRDPEAMLAQREEAEAEHAACEQWKDDPARARAERQYRAAMREEMQKEAERQKGLRVMGRRRRQTPGRTAEQTYSPEIAAAYLLRRTA